jgi:uncharacterized protein
MDTARLPLRRRLIALLGALVLVTSLLPVLAAPVGAAEPTLFFSEYVEGSGTNKALEIYNPTPLPVNLSASDVFLLTYFNGTNGVPPNPAPRVDALTGTVAAGDVYVVVATDASEPLRTLADQTVPGFWFNGDDHIQLQQFGSVIDSIGQLGVDPGTEWGTGLTSTQDNTLRRKVGIVSGDTNVNDAFDPAVEWDGFPIDTFDGIGSHSVTPPDNQPVVASCGTPLSVIEGAAATRTVTATDADGVVTSIGITSIVPSDPGTITIGATTPAPGIGGSASAVVSIGSGTPAGSYAVTITATNTEATPQSGSCTLTVNVQEVLTVGEIQGQTLDTENGQTDASPRVGQQVFVRGVVTQRIRQQTSSGGTNHSFFIQDSLTAADGDPLTSDGIMVFIGGFTTVLNITSGQPAYFAEVGDQVVLRGNVVEFFNLTELGSPRFVVEEIDEGNLAGLVETSVASPPDNLDDANRYWERHEGMRMSVAAGALVTAGRDVFASTADGEVWVINADHPLADRTDPFARRVYRDPHPLDDISDELFDNGNGMRILLVSHGLKWLQSSNSALIAPARTYDTVGNSLTGAVYFAFEKYGIEIEQQLELAGGVDPSTNAPPVPHDDTAEYATAPYNVENLYDFRDDPFDGCDFNDADNPGCIPEGTSFRVRPPYDYVPASPAAYEEHVGALAGQIVDDLHAPNILLIQEAEDQDICAVVGGSLDCDDGVNDRDGKPDTLQELALAIVAAGGPPYDAAYDRDGADDRGIVSAFLYRTDRVELLPADAAHAVLGSAPQIDYTGAPLAYTTEVSNPKALNAELPEGIELGDECEELPDGRCVFTRDPQVGYFRVWRDGIGESVFTDLYAISNHFSSTPDDRVAQRTEQASYLAAIVETLAGADDGACVIAGGDFNVFPRPDDPFPTPNESDQLAALYELGLQSLWDVVVEEAPASAYSYVFEGQAQTLDNQFATDGLAAELNGVRYAHVNADWAADFDGDGSRGASDHDPQVARYDALPTFEKLRDLLDHYVDEDLVSAARAGLLYSRLDRAEAFYAAGQIDAADAQLVAFGTQAQDLVPRFVDEVAADALQQEALLLIEVR